MPIVFARIRIPLEQFHRRALLCGSNICPSIYFFFL